MSSDDLEDLLNPGGQMGKGKKKTLAERLREALFGGAGPTPTPAPGKKGKKFNDPDDLNDWLGN